MNFSLDKEQTEMFIKWKDHDDCLESFGACGGRFTFSFTQTSLGCVCKVKCACGQELDMTDYNW